MEVKFNDKKRTVEDVQHGDLVRVNGDKFYVVFHEDHKGYRLNSLSGVGYYGPYQNKTELIDLLERKMNSNETKLDILPKDEYELQVIKKEE